MKTGAAVVGRTGRVPLLCRWYGHRETPILRHSFLRAVSEMPSVLAASGCGTSNSARMASGSTLSAGRPFRGPSPLVEMNSFVMFEATFACGREGCGGMVRMFDLLCAGCPTAQVLSTPLPGRAKRRGWVESGGFDL